MPTNPLLDALMNRSYGAYSSLTPEESQANDEAIYAQHPGYRDVDYYLNQVGDVFKGATGIGTPTYPTGVGSAVGEVGAAVIPVASDMKLVKNLSNLKSVGEPAAELISHLMRFKAPKVTKVGAAEAFSREGLGTLATSPITKGQIFNRMLERVPEADGVVELGSSGRDLISRPRGINTAYQRRASAKARFAPNMEEAVNREIASGKFDRATARDYNEVADALAGPQPKVELKVSNTERPTILRDRLNGNLEKQKRLLAKNGLTEDIVREIRSLPLDQAARKYPNIPALTLKDINKRNSWVWVPDSPNP